MTPAGTSPASRARSTLASVCPTRCSTPPGRARSGKMWPGRRRSDGTVAGLMATWIVVARSVAEIPVVTPKRRSASMLTVKAVESSSVFRSVICGRPSWSQRSPVSARQMRPRPCRVMKLIISGVASSAAQTRSPSFSRSSSSATMTILPLRRSSIACSMVPKVLMTLPDRRGREGAGPRTCRSCPPRDGPDPRPAAPPA